MARRNVYLPVLVAALLLLHTSEVSAGCSSSDKDLIALCTVASMKDWNVSSVDFNTHGRKFCCFIWNALECQVKVARQCDSSYADELSRDTERAYRNACVLYPRRTPKCIRPEATTTVATNN